MLFEDVLKTLGNEVESYRESDKKEFISLSYDSRKVSEKGLFVCLVGANSDGHKYVPMAVEKGASGIIFSNKKAYREAKEKYPDVSLILVHDTRKALALVSALYFGYPKEKLFVVGITGTKGKTSTTFLTKEILSRCGHSVGIIGTTGIYYADKYEYIDNSTPESYEIHRLFADMVNCGVTHVLMEVSSQALKMHRVFGIRFDIGVFTNISPDHIGKNEHSSFEEYLSCKEILFRQCDTAIYNADSDHIDKIKDVIKEEKIPSVSYAIDAPKANVLAKNIKFENNGELSTSFDIKNEGHIQLPTPGNFSVYNAMCAYSIAKKCGCDFKSSAEALQNARVFGRVEPVRHEKCDFSVIIDYAHNAISLESLFNSVKHYSPAHIYTVFGCGGNRSKLRRYDMGRISGNYSALSILTSDNPRNEKVSDIIDDILVGMNKTKGKYTVIPNRREAIYYALSLAKRGDLVLIVGKGNQLYEEIGTEKIHFDEREVVKSYFDEITLFDEKFKKLTEQPYDSFDNIRFPIVIVSEKSKIVYKNAFAGELKLFRTGSYMKDRIPDFENTVKYMMIGGFRILDCTDIPSFTKIYAVKLADSNILLCPISSSGLSDKASSVLMNPGFDLAMYQSFAEYGRNIAKSDDHSKKDKTKSANDTAFISRAEKLNSFLFYILRSTSESAAVINIKKLAADIGKSFENVFAAYGFRIAFSSDDNKTLVGKVRLPALVMLEAVMASTALMSACDKTAELSVCENKSKIMFSFKFRCENVGYIRILRNTELDIAKEICRACGWIFYGAESRNDGYCTLCAEIPFDSTTGILKASDPLLEDRTDTLIQNVLSAVSDILF